MFKLLTLLVMGAIAAWLCGCGKSSQEEATEKAIEKAISKESGGKVKADISKEKIEIKSKDGEMTIAQGASAEIPEGFPKDVPVYKGAKVITSVKQKNYFMVSLETGDDSKKVADTYKQEMKTQEWEEKSSVDMGEEKMLQYSKGKDTVIVSIKKDNEKSLISIVVSGGE